MKSEDNTVQVPVKELRKYLKVFNEMLGERDNDNSRSKLGQVLTVIDASFSDAVQRKAVKDLIQNNWYNNNGAMGGSYFNPHTELRNLTEALGFELYPASDNSVPTTIEEASKYNRYLDIK